MSSVVRLISPTSTPPPLVPSRIINLASSPLVIVIAPVISENEAVSALIVPLPTALAVNFVEDAYESPVLKEPMFPCIDHWAFIFRMKFWS